MNTKENSSTQKLEEKKKTQRTQRTTLSGRTCKQKSDGKKCNWENTPFRVIENGEYGWCAVMGNDIITVGGKNAQEVIDRIEAVDWDIILVGCEVYVHNMMKLRNDKRPKGGVEDVENP